MNASMGAVDISAVQSDQVMLLPGVVGFYFSFRLIILLLMVRVFQSAPETGAAVSVGLNFLLLAIVIFHSIGHAPETLASTLRAPSFRWVLVFLGFSGCSLLWSSTASLAAAVVYWCAMTADVVIVLLLLRTGPVSTMSFALIKGYVFGACLIAVVAWLLPAQSDLRLGDEELLGPNQIGYACAFAVFLAQYLISRGGSKWKAPAIFLAITLLRSLSKTTIVAFIAGEAFLLFRDTTTSRKSRIVIVAATAMVLAVFWGLIGSYYNVYTNAGNQAETLTGRIGIWAVFLTKALEQPWMGHGFHSVWKVIPPFGDFEARHAHNELLQQFYAYGVAGVLILVGLYGSFYRQLRRLPGSPQKTLLLSLLIFVLVRGLADTEPFDLSLPLWLITMISLNLAWSRIFIEVPA